MKYRSILSLLVILMVVLCSFRAWAEADTPVADAPKSIAVGVPQNVILISWDGLDRSVVKELLEKEKLPNLAALIKEGSRQDIDVKGHRTVTKPGHAEMLTGLAAEITGVYTNAEYRPIPEGYSIFEKLQKEFGGLDKIRCFMVTGKLAHVGGRGPDEITEKNKKNKKDKKARKIAKEKNITEAPPGADDAPKDAKEGEPFFLTKKNLDVFDAQQRNAEQTGPLCMKYLNKYKDPRYMAFLHFSDPDHAGHAHGSDSEEYRTAAVKCDIWLGKIVEWLKQETLYEKTIIYVMTDHGFNQNSHNHSQSS
ncbi:MAG: alkaline phosphatase family protein [Planctomycetota bacterium]